MDLQPAGATIPDEFIGLSFEMQTLLPDSDDNYFFRPDNEPLIALFHQLGIKSLRVGGNTADRPTVKVPGPADIDSLFAFAKAADVKVIYTLRLREGNRENAAGIAGYIDDHFRSLLTCFAIGNEHNVFAKQYDVYRGEWKRYVDLITAPSNAPDALFCGPSATPGKTAWARDFVRDFGRSGRIAFVSQHDYPGGAGNKATNVIAARDKMLSPDWLVHYQKFHDGFANAAKAASLPYRLEEVNNFFNGGANDVSDTFAAALWGLDYLHWWAAHGALGVNFHTGDQVAAGERMNPCRYATFWTSKQGYHVHPIGYGIKMFELGSKGRLVPVTLTSQSGINLTAYAVRASDQSLLVTLINKEHGADALDASVRMALEDPYRQMSVIRLGAGGDVALKEGVTLGDAAIQDNARWDGQWTQWSIGGSSAVSVRVPAASAALVKLSLK